jgi:2,4-dienoyl-CoA reductase-like NADH-dependent reductase (Old Yellow Enzyme family)/thioredoxin reductase
MYENLFKEAKIGNLRVPNRIVMTAMGNHMALPGGEASDIDVEFYGARAEGGVGLVILECLTVDYEHGKGNLGQMSADDDRFIPGLARVADAVHAAGSVVFAQLYHPGNQGICELNGVSTMPSPSGIESQAVHQPAHEMSLEEISDLVAAFAAAARRCKQAGIDGVEIHAAHGYLINQFLSSYTNERSDNYGGSLENRCRLLKEIIEATRVEVGSDYPIIVRLSVDEHLEYVGKPNQGIQLSEGIEIAKLTESYGADALDISCGIYETMNTAWEPVGFDEGWKIDAPAQVKAAVSVPVIGVSVIRNPAYAEKILAEGKVDFVGSARQFFADPQWANKAKEGREAEIRRCISCMYCMETLVEADMTGVTVACAINYQGGREATFGDAALRRDGDGRPVAVIGAGPAGLEAAIVLAKRGFAPIVFEKSALAGGQLRLASMPPKKEKMLWLLEYQLKMLETLGVEVRYNCAPSIEDIKQLSPYAVIIAQGSVPLLPASISGLNQDNVYTPPQILNGEVELSGKNIGVIGTGMTGIETAELLAEKGNKVTLFEMVPEIGPGLFFQNLIDVMSRLGAHQPEIYTRHKLVGIDGNQAVFETVPEDDSQAAKRKQFSFDAFLVSLGVKPNTELIDEIKANFENVFVIGDALTGGRLAPAIGGGYKTAFEL